MGRTKRTQQFEQNEQYKPLNEKERNLVRAFSLIKNEEESAAFLRDLMTRAEIEEFSNRLELAKQLMKGHPYLQIANEAGTSTTTVTRVAHWLFNGCGGYFTILKRMLKKGY